jgi:SAM-dependent methyltransferase
MKMAAAAASEVELTRALAGALSGIEGWLLVSEAVALHKTVTSHLGARRPITVVEIGSWKGRSTIALALALPSSSHGEVIAIDPHVGSREAELLGMTPGDTYSEFVRNIGAAKVANRVRVRRSNARDARAGVGDASVDVLFLDGSHVHEHVLRDIDEWTTALRPGATLAVNDWSIPDVWSALRRRVIRLRSMYGSPKIVANTLFVSFTPTLELRTPMSLFRVVWLLVRIRIRGLPTTWVRSDHEPGVPPGTEKMQAAR